MMASSIGSGAISAVGHNLHMWRHRFEREFVPASHRVVDVFLARLIPTFASAGEEAQSYGKELWDRAMSDWGDPDISEAEVADAVREAEVEYYLNLTGMEQGILNCCALFLYHLFEQHLLTFHRQELLHWREQNDTKLLKHDEIHSRLYKKGICTKSFASWGKLEELRHLANTLKHGEGKSSRELASLAPDLFCRVGGVAGVAFSMSPRVYTPLLGDDVFVTERHVREYAVAIEGFWCELLAAMEPKAGATW